MPGEPTLLPVTTDELVVLNNALNEVCHGLDLDDFETRMGFDRDFVQTLLGKIQGVLDRAS